MIERTKINEKETRDGPFKTKTELKYERTNLFLYSDFAKFLFVHSILIYNLRYYLIQLFQQLYVQDIKNKITTLCYSNINYY